MSEKLDRLRRERDKAERHLRKAANDEKALAHEADKDRANASPLHPRRYAGDLHPGTVPADRR